MVGAVGGRCSLYAFLAVKIICSPPPAERIILTQILAERAQRSQRAERAYAAEHVENTIAVEEVCPPQFPQLFLCLEP